MHMYEKLWNITNNVNITMPMSPRTRESPAEFEKTFGVVAAATFDDQHQRLQSFTCQYTGSIS